MIRIIGIDPGSKVTGYGIVDSDGQNIQLVEAGCIKLPNKEFAIRLKYLYDALCEICSLFNPQFAAVEEIFYARNVRSALQLGQTRGVILLGLSVHNCEVHEYTALQVKNAITGYGRAEKSQVKRMVETMMKINFGSDVGHDLTDALGLAITHAHLISFNTAIGRA
ncbi:MAG TPA: crossover junction endodeoxyribonuclease RuvC [Acidobacteriota bacterium]|jgi:crossover junction endodeoxyribonuclease RuvC|nr:crossover junction endodeoxyribonuclease RuvC [Acidobacteriota bacterium]